MYQPFTFAITAGLVLALSGSAGAQTPQAPRADQPNQKAPASAMGTDADFAQKAATGGKHEVEGAKFAASKSTNASVKSFANKLVKDHTAANNELMSLMKKKNITAGPDDKPAAEAWRNETGAAFDRAFIDHAITEHEKDIAAFEAESKGGSDPDLKAWAGKKLPTLREHLKAAQDLKSKLQTTTSR